MSLPSGSHAAVPGGVASATGRRTVHVLVALEHAPPIAFEQREADAFADRHLRCADGGRTEDVDHPERFAVDDRPGAFGEQDGTAEFAHGFRGLQCSCRRRGASPRDQWCAARHRSRGAGFERHGGGRRERARVGLSGGHWSLLHVGHDVQPADRRSTDFREAPRLDRSGQPVLDREDRGFRAGTDAEFGQDVADVPVHGPFAQAQFGGDLGVGPTVDDESQNLGLPQAQAGSCGVSILCTGLPTYGDRAPWAVGA
jgi:hypothetical protein